MSEMHNKLINFARKKRGLDSAKKRSATYFGH